MQIAALCRLVKNELDESGFKHEMLEETEDIPSLEEFQAQQLVSLLTGLGIIEINRAETK